MGDGTPTEMHYFANAQRNPWRWGTDYVLSGDTRWKGVLTKMMNFFVAKIGGNPNNLGGGYQLNGADMNLGWRSRGLVGTVVAGNYNVRIRYHAWAVKTISNVQLTAGSNSIAVVKDWGWIEVDWIEIAP